METIVVLFVLFIVLLFKSYYVVWKLTDDEKKEIEKFGLNRTMQYGNLERVRTFELFQDSLNRTMQYGNWRENKSQYFPFLFKSYYVVWKRKWEIGRDSMLGRFKSYYVVWKPVSGS